MMMQEMKNGKVQYKHTKPKAVPEPEYMDYGNRSMIDCSGPVASSAIDKFDQTASVAASLSQLCALLQTVVLL